MNNKEYVSDYLDYLSEILTKEEHDMAKAYIYNLSDSELQNFVNKIKKESEPYQNLPLKDRINCVRDLRKKHLKLEQDAACYYQKIEVFSEEETKKYLDVINRSCVQDYIYLTAKEDRFLIELWEGKQNWNINMEIGETRGFIEVPSDLVFAKSIPLTDCYIEIDERDEFPNGRICSGRFIIFNNYQQLVDDKTNEPFDVGAFVFYENNKPIYFIIITALRGVDSLLRKTKIGFFPGYNMDSFSLLTNRNAKYALFQASVSFLETWYGIQIALLHPDVKDVFKNPQRIQENNEKKQIKSRRRIVRYVRKHYITLSELKRCAHSEEAEKKYKRKCLVWYVIGHWRTYKNGTKVFIQPYWKGVMRKTKDASDVEKRNRKLSFGSELIKE